MHLIYDYVTYTNPYEKAAAAAIMSNESPVIIAYFLFNVFMIAI